MRVFIPTAQWFTVHQWLVQNYITEGDYSVYTLDALRVITFKNTGDYASFYHAWQHIICADNDL